MYEAYNNIFRIKLNNDMIMYNKFSDIMDVHYCTKYSNLPYFCTNIKVWEAWIIIVHVYLCIHDNVVPYICPRTTKCDLPPPPVGSWAGKTDQGSRSYALCKRQTQNEHSPDIPVFGFSKFSRSRTNICTWDSTRKHEIIYINWRF